MNKLIDEYRKYSMGQWLLALASIICLIAVCVVAEYLSA